MTAIPRRLGHIWIGPKPAPTDWMKTWPEKHPDWEYTIYDNDFLVSYPFRLRRHMNEYFWRGLYAGVQDMMRYEILYEFGGFMADADAICLHPVDELLTDARAYTVRDRPEGDRFRAVCPILACEPGNAFVGRVIEELLETDPAALRKAEVSTGNRFLGGILTRDQTPPEEVTIWSMHYFLPWHKSDPDNYYSGPDKVYAEQQYGTSLWAYNKGKGESSQTFDSATLTERRQTVIDRLIGGQGRPLSAQRGSDVMRREAALNVAKTIPDAEKSSAFQSAVQQLNVSLISSMEAAEQLPRFHGLHYYRHMQNQPMDESGFKVRSATLRHRLVGWLGSARRALLLGFDTGHLALAAHDIAPDMELLAIEGGRWFREKDTNPPRKSIYAPAAANWLSKYSDGNLQARAEDEGACLEGLSGEKNMLGFDLVMFANTDIRLPALIAKLPPLLSEDAVIVLASETKGEAESQVNRLRLQRMVYEPFDSFELPSGLGGYAAVRLIP